MVPSEAVVRGSEQDVTEVITGRPEGRAVARGLGLGALLVVPGFVAGAVAVGASFSSWAPLVAVVTALVVAIVMLRQAARAVSLGERHDTAVANLGLDAESRLPGARILMEVLADAIGEAQRTGRAVSVVMVSVDDLRPLMVERGLEAGAKVWRQVAAAVTGVVGVEGGRAFRLHGQAVLAVVPEASLAKAERIAHRIQPSLALASRRHGGLVRSTVGVAVALAGDLPEDVIRRAEQQCARQRTGHAEPPVPMLRSVPPIP